MLVVKDFHKSYGNKEIVKGISFEVNDGEIFGFIGHNGAGKTTTIKSIVGILDFESGEILIDGKSIKKNPIDCKKILAYIPDNPDLYEHLTGIKYLNFICDLYDVPSDVRLTRIKELSSELELEQNLGDSISSYSHGMKQKLALISAFVHNPKLLVLDEPFVGLDPKAAFTLKKRMRKMCDEGCSIFFSSHVLEVVEKLCDKVAILKDGVIMLQGDTEEIISKNSLEEIFLGIEK
ncbi:ABC transporter ATP-binding protein [Anaerorhabdus sp.]|uniref:ABC transporter ATP-binding protein n=1 Tax=Anaerorhabdus sp. TaxID=1872524 RepID=UPI002B21DE21|nr:ABC transporter ATP-binding protein [Anaerorhabdus sp.]MEA4873859.1 ABC transporter ATP-binding protein [Anaerorhabdus sp.]